MSIQPAIHPDIQTAIERIYDPCGFEYTTPVAEAESEAYAAHGFHLNGQSVVFRVAKTTPTKTGQFVTLWKRQLNGPIEPYAVSDGIDIVIITSKEGNRFGQFIFPKSVLIHKAIFSGTTKEGKRAMRVYPPWSSANSKQARQTQQWQLEFFLELKDGQSVDIARAQTLFKP